MRLPVKFRRSSLLTKVVVLLVVVSATVILVSQRSQIRSNHHDKVLDWNEQEFTVRFHADGTHTLSAEPSPYTAEMSIGTAICMLMGYKRPAYLKSIDRLTADAKTTALLERLIPTGKAYFSYLPASFSLCVSYFSLAFR